MDTAEAKVLINDGQHRKKAIEEALNENSDLQMKLYLLLYL